MSLLSAALRSQSCTSLSNSSNSSSSATTLPHSISAAVLLGSPSESLVGVQDSLTGSADLNDDSGGFLQPVGMARTPTEEELLFEDGAAKSPSRGFALQSSLQLRPIPGAFASDRGVAMPIRNQYQGSQQQQPQIARSCPRPILMPRRARTAGPSDLDDLDEFVPPHEIVASSLMDPSNVAESLCRKGSHMLRMRSSLLMRTGFLEGRTECSSKQ